MSPAPSRSAVSQPSHPAGAALGPTDRRLVLVVEDDPLTSELLTELLTDAGYAVEVLPSALGMLTAITHLHPCALVLDLGLPFRSGVAVLEDLRADPATAGLPVIVVSALTEHLPSDRATFATAVLAKPFDGAALVEALQAVG